MTIRDALAHLIDVHAKIGDPAVAHRFVLRKGREFFRAPSGERQWEPGRCFRNAWEALDDPSLTYVEGFGMIPGIAGLLVHHAWVKQPDGLALDATWHEKWERKGKAVYFGVEFRTKIVRRELENSRHFGLLMNSSFGFNFGLMFRLDPGLRREVEPFMRRRAANQARAG